MEKKKQVEDKNQIVDMSLRRMSDTYRMVIPESVERQIRQLCKSVWDVEWSGILFYKVEGSFEDNNLVIICQDIYPMDIGSSGYTEFDMSPEVANYIALHNNLMDCELGLVHSHHSMNTFFSGTDTSTLLEEGKDRYNFVSLIVNNKGTYTAAITRRVKHETVMQDTMSYKFYDRGEIKKETEVTSETMEEVEYFYLNIQIEGLQETNQFLSRRLKEISDRKKKDVQTVLPFQKGTVFGSESTGLGRLVNPNGPAHQKKAVQTTLWPKELSSEEEIDDNFDNFITEHGITFKDDIMEMDDDEQKQPYRIRGKADEDGVIDVIPFGEVHFDKVVVKRIVKQLLTCSLTVSNDSKVNPVEWITKMPKIFKILFKDSNDIDRKITEWAEFICYFLTEGCRDVVLERLGYSDEEQEAILAYDVMCELLTYKNKVKESGYIDSYIEVLESYMNEYGEYN